MGDFDGAHSESGKISKLNDSSSNLANNEDETSEEREGEREGEGEGDSTEIQPLMKEKANNENIGNETEVI